MKPARTLHLRREVLTELADAELEAIVGANEAVTINTICYGICPSFPPKLSCIIRCPITP